MVRLVRVRSRCRHLCFWFVSAEVTGGSWNGSQSGESFVSHRRELERLKEHISTCTGRHINTLTVAEVAGESLNSNVSATRLWLVYAGHGADSRCLAVASVGPK